MWLDTLPCHHATFLTHYTIHLWPWENPYFYRRPIILSDANLLSAFKPRMLTVFLSCWQFSFLLYMGKTVTPFSLTVLFGCCFLSFSTWNAYLNIWPEEVGKLQNIYIYCKHFFHFSIFKIFYNAHHFVKQLTFLLSPAISCKTRSDRVYKQ